MSAMQGISGLASGGLAMPVGTSEDVVQAALRTVRTHLGMEIAYLSEIVDGTSVFRAVDAPGLEAMIRPGDSRDLSEVYCTHIVAGRLPELMPDTADYPLATSLPITAAVPIGAHVSVPIRRQDGSVYGMFCCLSPRPNRSLNPRDISVVRMFADLAQREVQTVLDARRVEAEAVARVNAVMRDKTFRMAFQPIFDLATRQVSGFEALCRFDAEPVRSPDKWFEEAAGVGLGVDLEFCVLSASLHVLDAVPEPCYLSVNAGPDLVSTGRLRDLFRGSRPERLVLEVTEHAEVADYAALMRALADLRAIGVRIAVDDAGAGYSGLQHLVRLRPELIKLDRSLVSHVDRDPVLRSLCAALLHYTREIGAVLVAEGIETEAEAETLRVLGVHLAQGYLLGRPMPLADALALVRGAQATMMPAART